MGRLKSYVELVRQSRLLAPNLKEMTLRVFTGNAHRGNAVARAVVRDHLLALRWSNPNAVVYLREARGQGAPSVEYELWKDGAAAAAAAAPTTAPAPATATAAASAPAPEATTVAAAAAPAAALRARRLRRFEITHELLPEEVVAKVMMAARDPDEDDSRRDGGGGSGSGSGADARPTASASAAAAAAAAAMTMLGSDGSGAAAAAATGGGGGGAIPLR